MTSGKQIPCAINIEAPMLRSALVVESSLFCVSPIRGHGWLLCCAGGVKRTAAKPLRVWL
jgi:hypothetical protein